MMRSDKEMNGTLRCLQDVILVPLLFIEVTLMCYWSDIEVSLRIHLGNTDEK